MVNGHTRVAIHFDETAYVHTGNDGQLWTKEQVERSLESSQSCCESRKVLWPEGAEHCPCLACNVAKALIKHRSKS